MFSNTGLFDLGRVKEHWETRNKGSILKALVANQNDFVFTQRELLFKREIYDIALSNDRLFDLKLQVPPKGEFLRGKIGWKSNSCWVDSVIYVMLYIPNTFILRNILKRDLDSTGFVPPRCFKRQKGEFVATKEDLRSYVKQIQKALKLIYDDIQRGTMVQCVDLRRLLLRKECNVVEFLDITNVDTEGPPSTISNGILNLFSLKSAVSRSVVMFNNLERVSALLDHSEYLTGDYFIIEVTRLQQATDPIRFAITLEEKLTLHGETFHLFGIVASNKTSLGTTRQETRLIERNEHVIAFVLFKKMWYFYDGLHHTQSSERPLVFVGDFSKDLQTQKTEKGIWATRNSELLFYCKKDFIPFDL